MTTSTNDDLALKGEAVEEWIDLRFFRPIGIRIARALEPSAVSPDQVTLWSLWIGLLAAHLFVYESPWVNATAFVLVVVADLLDSADGQLARLRGTASRAGRIMDGYADNLRWIAVYVHVAVRLLLAGHGWTAVALAIVAGACHSLHSATVDFVHGAYLEIAVGKGRVDLPEDLTAAPVSGLWWKLATLTYGSFTERQSQLFPRTVGLLRRSRTYELRAEQRALYGARQGRLLVVCHWLGQNAHIALLGAATVCGRPSVFLWGVTGMTLIALGVVLIHERGTRIVAGA